MQQFLKKSLPILFLAVIIGGILFPVVTFAFWTPGQPVVPCGIKRVVDVQNNASITDPCTFDHLVLLGKNIMDILIWISIPLAAILFAYAGGTLIFSGGNEKSRDKAKAIFWSAAVGLAIMLIAYVIVYTIATALLKTGFYQGFFNGSGQQQQQQQNNTQF